MRTKTGLLIALSLALLACQASPNINNTPASANASSKKEGTVAAKFDLGQSINSNDFLKRPLKTQAFGIKQANGENFSLSDIERAVLTVVSAQIPEPATASLSRTEIANGWFNEFAGIPAGPATVTLEVFNAANQRLFRDQREVQVQGGAVTPVDFVITTNCGSNCNQDNITGSIAVSVRAITSCFAQLQLSPSLVDIGQAVSVSLAQTSGNITQMDLSYGDGQGASGSALTFPLSHSYASEGRYPVSLTVSGPSCINPYTATSYVSVSSGSGGGPNPPSANNLLLSMWDPQLGQSDVYQLQNGSLKALTRDKAEDYGIRRSANGSKLIFGSYSRDGNDTSRLYTMNSDGTGIRMATNAPVAVSDIWEGYGHLNADGSQFVFNRQNWGLGETVQVYLHKSDGTEINLTNDTAYNFEPNISPNGNVVSFASDRSGTGYAIYSINTDGSNLKRLTSEDFGFAGPHSWSPDGSRLVFTGYLLNGGGSGLFTMTASGGDIKPIYLDSTNQEWIDWPRWISANQIVFTGTPQQGGTPKLISIQPDGSNRQVVYDLPEWPSGIASNSASNPEGYSPSKEKSFRRPQQR